MQKLQNLISTVSGSGPIRRDLEPDDSPMNDKGQAKPHCDCPDLKDPCAYMLMTEEQKLAYRCEKKREAYRKRLECAAYKKQWGTCIKSIVRPMLPKKKTYKKRTYKKTTYKKRTYKKKPTTTTGTRRY